MRLPRFRVRTLMVVVLVSAYVVNLAIRNREFRRRAREHKVISFGTMEHPRPLTPSPSGVLGKGALTTLFSRERLAPSPFHEQHDQMAIKYERAARYPWLPVPPDPPEPK